MIARPPMRLSAALGLVLTVWCVADLAAQDRPRVLTLHDAIDQALTRGPRMLEQRDTVEQAQLSLRASKSAFHPKIVPAIQGSFGQTDINDQTYRVDVSQRFINGTEIRVGAGTSTAQVPAGLGLPDLRFYNSDTTLMLTQPLLKGFGPGTWGDRSAAKRDYEAARARYEDAILATRATVERTYWDLYAAERDYGVQQIITDRAFASLNAASKGGRYVSCKSRSLIVIGSLSFPPSDAP